MDAGIIRRGMAHGTAVRFLAVSAGKIADEAQRRHQLGRGATLIAAEVAVAALLISAYIKGEERITLQIQSEAPPLSLICDVTSQGTVRMRVRPPQVMVTADRLLRGAMMVIKHNAHRELYRAVNALDEENMTTALRNYLKQSHQVDGVLQISVGLDAAGTVSSAAGILVERMPPAPDLPSLTPEAFSQKFSGVEKHDAAKLLHELSQDRLLGEDASSMETRPVVWKCSCSMERIESMLYGLGVEELTDMLLQDNGAEVTCHFCTDTYNVPGRRLQALIALHEEQVN